MGTSPSDPDRSTRGYVDGPTERDTGSASGSTPTPPGSPPTGGGSGPGEPSRPPGGRSSRGSAAAQPSTGGSGTGRERSSDDAGEAEPVSPPTPFTQQLGRVTIVVLAALFGVFAVANSQRVDFSWVFGETIARETTSGDATGGVPLILLLLAAFAIGSVVTLLVELFVSRGRRARRAAAEGRDGKRRAG